MELDGELGVEREANRASFRVTHWVVPSVPARNPREPRVMRALSDYRPVRSPFNSKMRVKCTQDRERPGPDDPTVGPGAGGCASSRENPIRFPCSHNIPISIPTRFLGRRSDDVRLEGETSRFRGWRAPATTEIDSSHLRGVRRLVA